ncbi:hypothetical protein OKS68_13365 [Aeromonas veronii]|uniref:hypothetical protein n=1 Tax=Aeromonas veronii TaxID=654 RepID=UPI00226D1530|nr:hypothetical protein [Aeromonas veronii]MCX9133462.1 hypothetical protein [Aeromonas veronii]
MEFLLSTLFGGVGGAALVWLAKGWISERLKQSIQHEYAEKLESYKTELNSKIEGIRHENQVSQLRTSLFFDHQRDAFAALITKIAEINREWMTHYDPNEGLYEPVPSSGYREFESLLYQHQLFLDEECLMALSLVKKAYFRSLPYDDGSGAPPHQNDSSQNISYIKYLQPRIASIFRDKIGVVSDPQHLMDVAVLSAIEIVNGYHFIDIPIPPKGELSTRNINNAYDKVAAGIDNIDELVALLTSFDKYLSRDDGWLHEAQLRVKQTLSVLEKCQKVQAS